VLRLGVVSFLNSRPLIAGLADDPRVELRFDVPARLPTLLDAGAVDAALVPIVDVLRRPPGAGTEPYHVVSDACIGSDGETLTVRVFSQVPPDRVRTLWVDPDSHTSIALARVLWQELYACQLEIRPLETGRTDSGGLPAVLLIGDKVVDQRRRGFAYQVDLGGAWRQLTGLPFVFAVWARRGSVTTPDSAAAPGCDAPLAEILSAARDRGVAQAAEIAEREGPAHGWPVELARRYLTRCLTFALDARALEGADLFARHCAQAGIIPAGTTIAWPAELRAHGTRVTP
jgi:chorismate dehydratase